MNSSEQKWTHGYDNCNNNNNNRKWRKNGSLNKSTPSVTFHQSCKMTTLELLIWIQATLSAHKQPFSFLKFMNTMKTMTTHLWLKKAYKSYLKRLMHKSLVTVTKFETEYICDKATDIWEDRVERVITDNASFNLNYSFIFVWLVRSAFTTINAYDFYRVSCIGCYYWT